MTPTRNAEADRVEQDYHWALVTLGLMTLVESRALYAEVPATSQAANAAGWLRRAVALVMFRREQARLLALAYYRLVRALRTGATISLPGSDAATTTASLEGLRDEYDDMVTALEREAAAMGVDAAQWPQSPPGSSEAADGDPEQPAAPSGPVEPDVEYDADDFDEGDAVLLEEIERLEAEMERLEREAEAEAEALLDQLGIESMVSKLDEIDTEADADEVDEKRAQVHDLADKRQASVAMMIAENAARGLTYSLAEMDTRAIGWVRYSRTGTPCGFCAMLLSRGFVAKDGRLFRSRRSAGSSVDENGESTEDLDRFHPNCQCVAVPVFSTDQLASGLFDPNRYYADLWETHIKGKYGGAEALTEWRRLIRRLAQEQDTAAAQAAA